MDTLAFDCILPTTGRIPDFHRLETCAAGRTEKRSTRKRMLQTFLLLPRRGSSQVSCLTIHSSFPYFSRYFFGVMPSSSRKTWMKWLCEEKPRRLAISTVL